MLELLVFGGKPDAYNRDDFGGPDDFGLQVRRKDRVYDDPSLVPIDADWFGVFLGLSCDGYVIGVKDLMSFEVVRLQVYASMEALKVDWELD